MMDHAKLNSLISKSRKVGSLYRLAPEDTSVAMDTAAEPTVDPSKMSARVVISTPTTDRSGDEVHPEGCDLTNYRRNPLVLWEHGFTGGDNLPIGKSEDETGALTVEVTPQAVDATCFFSRSLALAEQVFHLIAERIIRGASVRLKPLSFTHGAAGLSIDHWDLEEWSWVCIPCNPEAVAKTLSDGRLCGRTLELSLVKSLSRVAPPRVILSRGWTPPEDLTMPKNAKPKTKAADMPEEDKKPEDDMPVETDAVDEEPVDDMPEEEAPKAAPKPGAMLLSNLGIGLKGMADALEEEMKNQENPAVLEYGASLLGDLRAKCDECGGKLKEAYPDYKMDDPAEEEAEGEVLKSMAAWVAKNASTSLQLRGLSASLERIAKGEKLTKSDKDTLSRAAKAMGKVVREASVAKSAQVSDSEKQAAKELEANLKRLNELMPAKSRAS